MKKVILYLFIAISLILMLYSLFMIRTGSKEINDSISEWNSSIYQVKNKKYISNNESCITSKEFLPVKYSSEPKESSIMGKIILLKTKEILPLIEGTSDKDLRRGAGHFTSTVLPGEDGNSSIFGHRDGIFRTLKNVAVGDIFIVETEAGVLYFKVADTKIVYPDDEIILKKYSDPTVTLVTCYPFYYVGSAPKRYVVIGKLITE